MDTKPLIEAYDAFHAAAGWAAFKPPAEGEWDAALILAHVAESSRTFADVSRSLLEGGSPAYDNAVATFVPSLRRLAEQTGSIEALRALSIARAAELVDLAARLTEAQCATPVHVRVIDGRTVRRDEPRAWGDVLNAQAAGHFPLHTRQLSALRA